ncbi:hypothetical protein C805_03606 [Eubacterium sp. 14-2]|nr:hypothetical protein C805_03606 [Eubacterium sp. 14-2]
MRKAGLSIADVERLHENKCLFGIEVSNDFDIDWLEGELDIENYRKLEKYILYYCSGNDELLFRSGFKYAWSLFYECVQKEREQDLKK